MKYRIIFAGAPEFACHPLQALIDAGHEIVAVYTQPDREAGRGRKLTPTPVKQLALEHNLEVKQPLTLRDAAAQAEIAAYQADLMIVVAYGLILPQEVLDTPKLGCLNIHASLLPRWRGAAPIQRAIEAGDTQTGVGIMQMDAGLDTGDILYELTCPINPTDTAQDLHDRLATLGAQAIADALNDLPNLKPQKQDDSQATYAHKLTKAEAEINWQEDAATIARKIHAFNPWPMAFTLFENQPMRVLTAEVVPTNLQGKAGEVLELDKTGLLVATGLGELPLERGGAIKLTQVQPAGKKAMSAYDFAQARNLIGHIFS